MCTQNMYPHTPTCPPSHSPHMTLPAGVALDDLVFICTKIARQMDSQGGVDKVFEAMEAARAAIEDAKPLLSQAVKLSDEVGAGVWDWLGGRVGGLVCLIVGFEW